jgi:hypothetical protein
MKKSHRILQALADATDGLLTSDVAAAIGEADAVGNVSALLTYAANNGRVVKVSGGAGAGEATWQLTDHGRAYLDEIIAEHSEDGVAPYANTVRQIISRAPVAVGVISAPLRAPSKTNGTRHNGALPPIEHGVPLPGIHRTSNKYRAAALAMRVGDRIVFGQKTKAHALAVQMRKEGFKAALRLLPDGQYGVWRVR